MNKYNARAIVVEGERFDSQAEYYRHLDLELLQAAGEISDLERQPVFEMQPAFVDKFGKKHRAISYRADWRYVEDGKIVVEDYKGFQTAVFKLKAKMFRFKFPEIELRLT
jgi:hypothetical protein